MRAPKTFASMALLTALLLPSAAAAVPEGSGRVTVLAGYRLTPNDHFAAAAAAAGQPLEHAPAGGPAGVLSFGYEATSSIEVDIELLGGWEPLQLKGQPTLNSLTYGGMAGVRWLPDLVDGLNLSFGAYTGPILVNESGGGHATSEQLVTGFMGEAGLMWHVATNMALNLEYRFLYARGSVSDIGGINGGGSWVGVGVTFWIAPTGPPVARF